MIGWKEKIWHLYSLDNSSFQNKRSVSLGAWVLGGGIGGVLACYLVGEKELIQQLLSLLDKVHVHKSDVDSWLCVGN